jgi:hypothetical protein
MIGLLTNINDELSPFQNAKTPSVCISFTAAYNMVSLVFDKAEVVCSTQKGIDK